MEQINKQFFNWASSLEDKARQQAIETASMPFIYPHLALMPDAHWGMGATVGSVLPTLRAIIPSAIGVDIGCGMLAALTDFTRDDLDLGHLATLRESIERAIPLSKGVYNKTFYGWETCKRIEELESMQSADNAQRVAPNWRMQLGSLGGGNHFIEVSFDELNRVWLFLHSGSRGVGNKLAMQHMKIAKTLCDKWWITLPNPELAYLPEGTDEFWTYIRDLRWAQAFANDNRLEMDRISS